jgi:hypothetical protein
MKFLVKGLIILTFNQSKQIKQLQSKTTTSKTSGRAVSATPIDKTKDLKIKALEEEVKRLKLGSKSSPTKPKTTTTTTKIVNNNKLNTTTTFPKHKRASSVTIENKNDIIKLKK